MQFRNEVRSFVKYYFLPNKEKEWEGQQYDIGSFLFLKLILIEKSPFSKVQVDVQINHWNDKKWYNELENAGENCKPTI